MLTSFLPNEERIERFEVQKAANPVLSLADQKFKTPECKRGDQCNVAVLVAYLRMKV